MPAMEQFLEKLLQSNRLEPVALPDTSHSLATAVF